MFNESIVSSSVQNQFPLFYQEQYPTFVQFLQNYYQFLESNGNPLDLINGLLDITDIDTYAEIDLRATTKEPISVTDTEISVIGHVKFPRTDGLLKINDEVILYKEREYITDEFNVYKITVFKGCVRGYSYNELSYEDGFVSNIPTVATNHIASSIVINQSFNYLLYFLDKLRQQFLVNYPQNSLLENKDKINFNVILKRIKDFYLSKGTPKGIEFYFKYLFQDVPEITNYKSNLMAPSDAIYQNKFIIRTESLDNYYIPDLVGNTLVQNSQEFNVQTVENNFAGASQVYELEISNGQKIVPTQFAIITQYILNNRLYVDTTFGFDNAGFLRIGDEIVQYSKKEYNYFELLEVPNFYEVGQRIYDLKTLASVKNRPDSYFLIFAGITGFDILKNYSYYQEGDIGFVKDISINISNLLLTSWITNENLPVLLNKNLVSGVSSIYTDSEAVYIYSSGIPYYTFNSPDNVQILDSKYFKKIPLTFTKSLEGFREKTIPDSPVGFLVDGTPILNWKSNVVITRGSLKTVNIIEGGNGFNVHNPPTIEFSAPTEQYSGTQATGELIINGSVKDVYVENSGSGYPTSTILTVIKDPSDTEFNSNFKEAVLEPVIVKGKITRVKILEPGFGYTKQPTINITPNRGQNSAVLSMLVDGPIHRVKINNPGTKYDANPSALVSYGDGGSAVLTIQNGKITNIQSVNNGQNYKSAPIVKVVDTTGKGQGAKIISKINPVSGAITEYKILNSGINYSEFGTYVEIYESGKDQFLEPVIDRWTLINNYNSANNQYYNNSDGSLLFGLESLQNIETVSPRFEEIPYQQYTQIASTPQGDVMNVIIDGQVASTSIPSYDLINEGGFDLIDDGYISLSVPFDIRFGSTSNTPTLIKKGEKIYINTNGFIFFDSNNSLSSSGWAAEQLTPTSIGASIQIGKDDLIIDRLFSTTIERTTATIYTINELNSTIIGGDYINNWPGNTTGLYFRGIERSLTTQTYNTLSGGALQFDFIYSTPPATVGDAPEFGEEVRFQYSLNNGQTWVTYTIFNLANYINGDWNSVSIPITGILSNSSIKFRFIQPSLSGLDFDTWGLKNLRLNLTQNENLSDLFVIRYEGYHFLRGLNKTNPIKFEIVFEENLSNINYDTPFKINIIENDATVNDLQTLELTYGNDNSYEFNSYPVSSQKSYSYYNEIIPASDVVFPKEFTIIGAPKKLKLQSGLVNLTDPSTHSPLIGWALDGAPIYGPYGYSNPLDSGSDIKKMVSGWKILNQNDPQFNNIRITSNASGGLQNYTLGSFEEDYYWSTIGTTLDRQNGRYCVTPEFPNGVYAYFMTVSVTDNLVGFPYFIGSEYAGKTYSEFNSLDSSSLLKISNLQRYLNPQTSLYKKTRPLDPGTFVVNSVPSSTEATLKSINVVDGGSSYKVGDKLIFDNTGTEGFGAAGFVSVIKGKPVTSTLFTNYDYIEYEDENYPFTTNSIIKTTDGFTATIHSVNQSKKYAYLKNVSGNNPIKGEVIYDSTLTPEVLIETELAGINSTVAVTGALATTCNLVTAINSISTYLELNTFTNCTINDFNSSQIKKYIKIDDEYMLVRYAVGSNNIIVERGINSIQTTHNANSQVTLLSELPVFDSSKFNINDIIKVDDEIFKIINITVSKTDQYLFTKIIDGSGTSGANIYYLFIDEVLQVNSSATIPSQGTVVLNANGDVIDLIFDQPSPSNPNLSNIAANPKIEILTSATYNPNNIVANINIISSTYKHILTVERSAFGTLRAVHYPREQVNRLIYVNAKVKSYEEDRILARFNSANNGLVQNDNITVSASRRSQVNYNLNLNTTTNPVQFSITRPSESYSANQTIVLYEKSKYSFTVQSTESIIVQFFSFSNDIAKQKEYFDIDNLVEVDGTGKITKFTITPKDSDLTNLVLRITSEATGISRSVNLNIRFEPYNGEFQIENSTSNYFEFYINRNPIFTDYNSNTINYVTTSKFANGPIFKTTLTSGGFNYKILPTISGLSSANGVGANLEAFSNIIGSVKSIDNSSNGYGYSPNPSYSPVISFPVICKLKNNYNVVSYKIENPGEGYLFTPSLLVTGGGLGDGDLNHAILRANINNERLISIDIINPGVSYSSAPQVNVEKSYFASINSNGDLTFKFNFNSYFQENDSYKVRAYYLDSNSVLNYRESSVTFYSDLQTSGIKSKLSISSTTYVNPRDYINENGIVVQYYRVVLNERKAALTLIVDKGDFFAGEKIIINNNPNIFGYISSIKGWQKSNSIIRITGLQYDLSTNDIIRGVDSESYGQVDFVDSVTTSLKLGAYLEQPKQFLNDNSFLSENVLKLQDSLKYQKFAYEISTNIPVNKWRENYIATAHPAGYNLFAKTKINQKIKLPVTSTTKVNVSTDVSSIVRLNQKYNYLISKNISFDEVTIANKLLTDVKNIKTSVVAAFEDISDQFDGIKSSFELRIIDPVQPKEVDGITDRYITNYTIDQMLVVLDNIIQTYGDSWTVTDADKAFDFSSVQNLNQLMPGGDILYYRQFNEGNPIYGFNKLTTSAASSFPLVKQDGSAFPSSVTGANYDADDWLVFVDGVVQLSGDAYTVTGGNLVFTETIPSGSQISARCIVGSYKNQFTNGTYTSGSVLSLSSKPTTSSKESYFVFVDGVLIQTSDYELNGSGNIIFNYTNSFNYDSLVVFIDPLGVSLETSLHNILDELYIYKIEDGQTDIPVGITIDTNQYILDINGVVQTPFIAYTAGSSGVRKINFTEPPQRYIKGDIDLGRQFLGLLYQRRDFDGSFGSTPNYQFDDISKNRLFVNGNLSQLIVGDFIINPNNNSNAVVDEIIDKKVRKTVVQAVTQTLTLNQTANIPLNSISELSIGDRVIFDVAIGLSALNAEALEITSINKNNNTVTVKNITSNTIFLTIPLNNSIRFSHRELILIDINTSEPDRDNAFASGDTLYSGYISSFETTTETTLNEPYMVLSTDTTITVNDASIFSTGQYILVNNIEVMFISNISSNTLTVSRGKLNTIIPSVHPDKSNVTRIIPLAFTCNDFIRGFDGNKTTFPLLKKETQIYIEANKDIFVIVNGILQKRGTSYSIIENDPDGIADSGDEYSEIQFSEAPSDSVPFNCFYVGETISIQNISSQFNGVRTSFDLRSVTGEIFSLISNSRPEANISANLILFIDGVYQIPSTTEPGRLEAYDDLISSYKLLGSVIDFTAPPKRGSDFEGYIFVGSIDDYNSVDIDVTIENDDLLVQYNEIAPRRILQKTSATKLSVSESFGLILNDSTGINLGSDKGNNWWKTDLIKRARVRESLRARRSIQTTITAFGSPSPYPLTGKTLYTTTIPSIEVQNISSDLPTSPDDDTNKISFLLPATSNFPSRMIDFSYVSFVPRNPLISGSKDVIQNIKIQPLPFNQILKVSGSATDLTSYTFAGNANTSAFTVVNFDSVNKIVYIKLADPSLPVTTTNWTDFFGFVLTNDNLVNEYQTLSIGTKLLYNF